MRLARVAGEIAPGAFKPDRHGLAGSSLEVEAAERTQLQLRHRAENTSLFSARSRQERTQERPTRRPGNGPDVHVSHASKPIVASSFQLTEEAYGFQRRTCGDARL